MPDGKREKTSPNTKDYWTIGEGHSVGPNRPNRRHSSGYFSLLKGKMKAKLWLEEEKTMVSLIGCLPVLAFLNKSLVTE